MAKKRNRRLCGGPLKLDGLPDWRPLLEFAPEEIRDFMWMYRLDLEDGTVVEAYKHYYSRGYLHLAADGRAFGWVGESLYEEVDRVALLTEVLDGQEPRANIVRQNDWVKGDRIAWARSATRHRIARRSTLFVIQHAGICFERGVGSRGEPRLFFFGEDDRERPLEVIAFGGFASEVLVVHSMRLRDRFKDDYWEARKWRR
jgi:hypothetical protein